ncbi:MAG: hypothetical protein ABI947_25550 [Chloroflexota bacterium]
MELKQLWAVVLRRWWLIVLPALVALVLTLPALRQIVSPPSGYAVTIRFTASQVPSATATQSFQDQSYIPWLASEYAVNALAMWMRTDSFAREIVDNLKAQGKSYDVETVRSAISNTDNARSIMTLYLVWPDPDEIKLFAQAATEVLQKRNQVYFPQFGAQGAVVTPMDAVIVTRVPAALATRLQPLFRILIGLAVGLVLAFLAEYLDPTIRNRREVEALDLAVIAEIPRH